MECRRSTSEAENIKKEGERERERETEKEMDAGSRSPSRHYEIVARLAALPSSHWVACGVRMDWTDADTGLPLPDRAGETQRGRGTLSSFGNLNLIAAYSSGPAPHSATTCPPRVQIVCVNSLNPKTLYFSLSPFFFFLQSIRRQMSCS